MPPDLLQRSMVDRFEQVVAADPERIAVSVSGVSMSYRALNEAANRLAHFLLSSSIDNVPIPFLIGHDSGAVIAMMGILKTGRPYVALNPDNPLDQNNIILADLGAHHLLTDPAHHSAAYRMIGALPGLRVLDLGELDTSGPGENPGIPIGPEAPANITYTSGSTGAPKGSISSHRFLNHQVQILVSEWGVSLDDRILLLTSLSFAFSSSSIFLAFLTGAAVVMLDFKSLGLNAVVRRLADENITIYRSTPSTFRAIFSHMSEDVIFDLFRLISLAGEPVNKRDIALFRTHTRDTCLFYIGFSSTEAGILAGYFIDHSMPVAEEIIAGGYPLEYNEILIVDENGQPVDEGQVGEIVVRSPFISPGYWNRPDLMAEKYSLDPQDQSKIVFHTGDLGRLRPDGMLELHGRKDAQVKIRGYRIEPMAVASVLYEHPGVQDLFITTRPTPHKPDQNRLIAYLVPRPSVSLTEKGLHDFLASRLPHYMIPARFVFLEELPLNSNGKVNAQELPEPGLGTSEPYAPPRDPLEQTLVQIWEQAFNQNRVGIRDDFSELGGDSLLAAQILTEVESRLNETLPLAFLAECRTIEEMAKMLKSGRGISASSLVMLQPNGSGAPLFLFPGRLGDVFYFHDLARLLGTGRPVYGVEIIASGTRSSPSMQLEETAAAYLGEIREVQPTGPYYLAGHSFGGLVAFEIARQLTNSGERVGFIGLLDTYAPGSVLRASPAERASMHLGQLQHLDWVGRRDYLRARAQNVFNGLMRVRPFWSAAKRLHSFPKDVSSINGIAARGYRPVPYPGKVDLFRSGERPEYVRSDPTASWQHYAPALQVHDIPGSHASLVEVPNVDRLADEIIKCLEAG
ncbi:MAG: alpha/beta fold hydrolase [Anaerolineales bacterium]